MARHDREHFEDYREQTRVKHEILAAYLPAFFHILKRWQTNLVYIDAFAGSGVYTSADSGETFDGSPILALSLFANNDDFSAKISSIFIEPDEVLFPQLQEAVGSFLARHGNIREPKLLHGTFADGATALLDNIESDGDRLAPCFLFVDPCGVDGASFQVMKRTMDVSDSCEVFIFFNIDGVRRIAGLKEFSSVLVDLLGDEADACRLHERFHALGDGAPEAREELILGAYRRVLVERMEAPFVVPFRVEHEGRRSTSHYLIHATRHPLGFKIMKDVMWRRGKTGEGGSGLEFVQASHDDQGLLMRPDWDTFRMVYEASSSSTSSGYRCQKMATRSLHIGKH